MSRSPWMIILLFIFSITAAAQTSPVERDVLAFMERYQAVVLARDIPGIEAFLSPEYSYTNPQGAVEKRAELLDFYRQEKASPTFKVISLQLENPKVRTFGDTALVTADWNMRSTAKLAHPGDPPHQDKGRYTGLLVKQNGRWMVVHEHDSEQSHDKKAMELDVAALGRAYTDMIRRADEAAIARILADDYIVTDEEGTRFTKEQDLATYKDRAKNLKIETVEYRIKRSECSPAAWRSSIRPSDLQGSRTGSPLLSRNALRQHINSETDAG